MMERLRRQWRLLLLWTLGLLAGGAALALMVAYSGILNIAASAGHPAWLEAFLQLGKERSVKFNSRAIEPPTLELAELVPLGAAHFQGTCAVCHGTPLQPVNPIFGHTLPHPPDLQLHAKHWTRAAVLDCASWPATHRHAGVERSGPR